MHPFPRLKMKNILLILLSALVFTLPAAEAKPDFNKIIGKLSEAGVQLSPQGDGNGISPLAAIQEELVGIKEGYKEEGRAYARELGDIMMERAMANKKVDNAVDSVRALCWGVVLYITLISILLFGMMLRINALLGKIRQEKARF